MALGNNPLKIKTIAGRGSDMFSGKGQSRNFSSSIKRNFLTGNY